MIQFNRIAAIASGYGLVASIAWHVLVLMGRELPPGLSTVLFVGIFAVWFPAIIAVLPLRDRLKDLGGWRVFKVMVAGAPTWMYVVAVAALAYAMVNFFLATGMVAGSVGDKDPEFQRVGSGHAIAFYAAAMAMLYAASIRAGGRQCINAHWSTGTEPMCPTCGAPFVRERESVSSRPGA